MEISQSKGLPGKQSFSVTVTSARIRESGSGAGKLKMLVRNGVADPLKELGEVLASAKFSHLDRGHGQMLNECSADTRKIGRAFKFHSGESRQKQLLLFDREHEYASERVHQVHHLRYWVHFRAGSVLLNEIEVL